MPPTPHPPKPIVRFALSCTILLATASPSIGVETAHADNDVRRERLRGLGARELSVLEPHAANGLVALVEFANTSEDKLPAINVMTMVDASHQRVLTTVSQPEKYPHFMNTLSRVAVVKRDASATVYDWGWDMAVFRLGGRNIMRVYRDTTPEARRGHRVTVDNQSGDFGTGRMTIRILPRGRQSLLVLSLRLDLRRANYIARQAAQAARSVNRSANMALGYTMLMSFKRRAEGKAVAGTLANLAGPISRPAVDERSLWPLLARGDVVISHMRGDQLIQTSVFGRVEQKVGLVRHIMLDAEAFGSALLPGSSAEIVARRDNLTVFDWDIDIPVIGLAGRMQLRDETPLVSVDALDGALSGGRWQFHTTPVGDTATLVSSWANFDLRKSNWLLQRIVSADPFLSHGMNAAGEVMLLRALRSRARKKAKQQAQLT
ncbi:MAG: hypothetical protein OXR73_38880, partial [Myxococcales bacterium]|nr:hypothetical protein [Myxococcales bacterium]